MITTCNIFAFLEIQNHQLTTQCLESLSNGFSVSPSLAELRINGCRLTTDDYRVLNLGLSKSPSLNIIDLSSNHLDSKSGRLLGMLISAQGQRKNDIVWLHDLRGESPEDDLIRIGLCEINVQGNNISDEGVKDIIDFLKHDSWLRSLNLRDNGITKIGIVEFIKVLTQNESLLSLDLRGNPGFNRKASQILLKYLTNNMEKFKLGLESKEAKNTEKKEPRTIKKIDAQKSQLKKLKLQAQPQKKNLKLLKSLSNMETSDKHAELNPNCRNCKTLQAKLLKQESKCIDLCIENSKMRAALPALMDKNTWAAFNATLSSESLKIPIFEQDSKTRKDQNATKGSQKIKVIPQNSRQADEVNLANLETTQNNTILSKQDLLNERILMSQYEETITNVGKNVEQIVSKKHLFTYCIEINAI